MNIPGIHHITAFAGDPQANVDFYTRVLGLRLVKQTVNFDAPDVHHLYYGDESGNPGTILTFFPFPGSPRGRIGNGQAAASAFSIPSRALGYWQERLQRLDIATGPLQTRFGDVVLPLTDPDGLQLELIAHAEAGAIAGWDNGDVLAAHAIRGFHSITLWQGDVTQTQRVLGQVLGFVNTGSEGARTRWIMGNTPGLARFVDVVHRPGQPRGTGGAGTVHHVAWRARTDAEQAAQRAAIAKSGLSVTEVLDRQYFRSIYFREPGGVLFEIATDPPGFLIDEPLATLGSSLKLPAWLEPQRAEIAQALPVLNLGKDPN